MLLTLYLPPLDICGGDSQKYFIANGFFHFSLKNFKYKGQVAKLGPFKEHIFLSFYKIRTHLNMFLMVAESTIFKFKIREKKILIFEPESK